MCDLHNSSFCVKFFDIPSFRKIKCVHIYSCFLLKVCMLIVHRIFHLKIAKVRAHYEISNRLTSFYKLNFGAKSLSSYWLMKIKINNKLQDRVLAPKFNLQNYVDLMEIS